MAATNILARRTFPSALTGAGGFDSTGGTTPGILSHNTTSPINGAGDVHLVAASATNGYGVISTLDAGGGLNLAEVWIELVLKLGLAAGTPSGNPSTGTRLIRLRNAAGNASIGGLLVQNSGKLHLIDTADAQSGSDSALTMTADASSLYRLGLRYKASSGASDGIIAAYAMAITNLASDNLDDTTAFASVTNHNVTDNIGSIRVGDINNATWECWFDDIALGNDGFPGPVASGPPSRLVLLGVA